MMYLISTKYKKIYDEFIKNYEEIHVNPWHHINKDELNAIYDSLIVNIDVNDEYSFKYFMDYITKRLSGLDDAHSGYRFWGNKLPFVFQIIEDEVLVKYPDELKGYSLFSINDIPIDKIISELDDVIVYGTIGKKISDVEALLSNDKLFSLPSLRNTDEIEYRFEDENKNVLNKIINKNKQYENNFNYNEHLYEKNATYEIIDNCLIYTHSSVQLRFKETIEDAIKRLEQEDLGKVDTIIVDIRGNTGGHSKLNELLMNFLRRHSDKKLICLTDYRVFSGGRFALRDLLALGATSIGEGIGTPINSYGNFKLFSIDNHEFFVSTCYHHPCKHLQANSKEQFKELITKNLQTPIIFKPDIEVKQTKKDFLSGVDTTLRYAIKHSKINRKKR